MAVLSGQIGFCLPRLNSACGLGSSAKDASGGRGGFGNEMGSHGNLPAEICAQLTTPLQSPARIAIRADVLRFTGTLHKPFMGLTAMIVSKFARASVVLSAIWIVGSIVHLWPDEDLASNAEWRAFDVCMGSINTPEGHEAAKREIESLIEEGASPDEVRAFLQSLGFSESQILFSDSVFLDPGEGGIFDSPAALQEARTNKVTDCQRVGSRSGIEAVRLEWLNVVKSTGLGLLALLTLLLLGRLSARWIMRGE